MKLKVKIILGAFAILLMLSTISCSKQHRQVAYNDRVVVLCNKLTNIMDEYTAHFADVLDNQNFSQLKELSEFSEKEISILYNELNQEDVNDNNKEFQDKIIHYFNISRKLVSIGYDLSDCDSLYDNITIEFIKTYADNYKVYELAINDLIKYQNEFANNNNLLIE